MGSRRTHISFLGIVWNDGLLVVEESLQEVCSKTHPKSRVCRRFISAIVILMTGHPTLLPYWFVTLSAVYPICHPSWILNTSKCYYFWKSFRYWNDLMSIVVQLQCVATHKFVSVTSLDPFNRDLATFPYTYWWWTDLITTPRVHPGYVEWKHCCVFSFQVQKVIFRIVSISDTFEYEYAR